MRRERILEAALEVFAERGYQASMAEVAEAAGITRSVLYYYFPAKRDLFLAVLEARCQTLLAHVSPRLAPAGTREDRPRAALDAVLSFAAEHPSAWRVMCRDLDDADPTVREAQSRVRDAALGAAVLLAAEETGFEVDPDSVQARVLSELIYGAVTSVVSWWLEHPEVPREEVLAAMVDITRSWLGQA